jgi:sirohydrochlorin ferrochelatase
MHDQRRTQENSSQNKPLLKDAVILLGHGSRVPEAGKSMEKVAAGLKRKYGYAIVEVCYLSRLGPHFPEIFEKCVKQGADCVVVIPYFLHEGLHIVLDIPSMIQKTAARFPNVRVLLGKNLGFDDVLVDLVEKRIIDCRPGCDVREMVLPSKSKYPVPEGQYEFVPMAPEDAAKYVDFNEDDHC